MPIIHAEGESQCLRVPLKPGKTEAFLKWARSISQRPQEVSEALKTEGILAEHIFLERGEQGDFVVFYTRARSLMEAAVAFQSSRLAVDREAAQMMQECWDLLGATRLEQVIDFAPGSPASEDRGAGPQS